MTPYELTLSAEAFHELKVAEMERDITMAWLREYYHRQKYLPNLKDEIRKLTNKEPEEMTDDEMLEQVKRLNAMMGGSVV
jgi:protoheme ferro-lyase